MKNILYTKFFNDNIQEDVNVILSPQFYWIKKIEVSLKSLSEAKKISQNYFDLDENYMFDAVKVENNYFAIAVDKNIDIKIDKKYIKSLKIAQTEFYNYDEINLENNYKLKKIEDILFCFPNHSETAPFVEKLLSNIKLSNYKLNLLNTIEVDKSSIILLSLIFLLFTGGLILNIIAYKSTINHLEIKKEELKKYNLPLTNIQLNSILGNLQNIQYNNILLKKDLKFITKVPLNKNDKLLLLQTIPNGYEIEIQTNKNLNSYFKQRFIIKSFNLSKSIYKAEIIHG